MEMINDRGTGFDLYKDYGIKGVVPFLGEFEHPWFLDNDRHKLMLDWSREYIHLRALKTGTIYQIRLTERMPRYKRREGILFTSTDEDTAFVFAVKEPSFQKTIDRFAKAGKKRPSDTSYTGYVNFGNYVINGIQTLLENLDKAGISISDYQLKSIYEDLLKRRELYATE